MKKVLSVLILTSFLAVLAVPALVSAIDNCPYRSCNGVNPIGCRCGSAVTTDSHKWCTTEMAFNNYDNCYAAMGGGSGNGYQEAPTVITTGGDLVNLINKVGNWIFTILLAVAGIMLIMAGFFWITAGGNPENVKKASDMLRNSLIGVAVAVGAKGLVLLIENIVKG